MGEFLMYKLWIVLMSVIILSTGQVFSVEEKVAADQTVYTVKDGDTMWDLAEKFYNNPYQWVKIQDANLHIANPDKIIAGQQLVIPGVKSDTTVVQSSAAAVAGAAKPKKITIATEQKPVVKEKVSTQKVAVSTSTTKLESVPAVKNVEPKKETVTKKSSAASFPAGLDSNQEKKPVEPKKESTAKAAFPAMLESTPEKTVEQPAKPSEPMPVKVVTEQLDRDKTKVPTQPVQPEIVSKLAEDRKYMDNNSFIAPLTWKGDGIIVSDQERKALISMGDLVYLDIGSKQGLKPAMRCNVYRKIRTEYNPRTGEAIGNAIQKVGVLKITNDVEENMATARVITSNEPLKIGDWVRMVKETP